MFLFRWARRLVSLLVAVAFVYLVVNAVEVVTASRVSRAPSSVVPDAAIVVIGSASSPSGISADLKARCEQAAALYADHKAPLVITTGGPARAGDPSEASVAGRCLRAHGVAKLDQVAAGTIPAQLSVVKGLLARDSGNGVILVADPLQTKWLRAVGAAEGLAVQASPAPAPKGTFWGAVGTVWSQSLAVALGRVVGYGHTGWIGG